jgi:hypothetical protein
MSHELAKANDLFTSDVVMGARPTETARATGHFKAECYDADGNLKWVAENHNLVVNVGLQYMAGVALTSTSQSTSWYIGLYGAGASNTPAATDTLASHAGWTEVTPYSGSRPSAGLAAATNANPSVVTNSASPTSFSINATATVGGAFLCNAASGTSGILFSASDFQSPGDRTVASGDTLNVTYTFSLSA